MPDVPQPAQPTPPPPAPPGRAREVSRLALLTVRLLGYLVYVYIAIVEAILVLGFFLRLFGANPNTDFVDFIYRSLDRIMAPFRAIFDPIELGTAPNDVPAVLDTSILFATGRSGKTPSSTGSTRSASSVPAEPPVDRPRRAHAAGVDRRLRGGAGGSLDPVCSPYDRASSWPGSRCRSRSGWSSDDRRAGSQSSLSVTATDLAAMGATLADGGVNPLIGERVVAAATCRYTLAVMTTVG